MHPHPVNKGIWAMLSKIRKLEQQLRAAGLPLALARLPYWLLALQYYYTMRPKLARIERVASRIRGWHATVLELCAKEEARTELIDVRQAMRDDLECTKRTLWDLREICIDVTRMFTTVGYSSRRLARLQEELVRLLSESYESATLLQRTLAEHDAGALALLRQMQDGTAA